MAKFEIEMELTGLKVKIKGEREDIRAINEGLGQQITGLLRPTSDIVEGEVVPKRIESTVIPPPNGNSNGKGNKGRASRARKPANQAVGDAVLSWGHDPGKWGNPRQTWKAGEKILWLLYVVDQETEVKELSGPSIAEAFNTHFRQAGQLKKNNMPRDLGALKQKTPALVGDRAEHHPITWFLTDEGTKEAVKLVQEARGVVPQANQAAGK